MFAEKWNKAPCEALYTLVQRSGINLALRGVAAISWGCGGGGGTGTQPLRRGGGHPWFDEFHSRFIVTSFPYRRTS